MNIYAIYNGICAYDSKFICKIIDLCIIGLASLFAIYCNALDCVDARNKI